MARMSLSPRSERSQIHVFRVQGYADRQRQVAKMAARRTFPSAGRHSEGALRTNHI